MNKASMQLLELFKDDWSHPLQAVRELLNNGADVNSADAEGNTPLLLELTTCFGTSEEVLEFICKNGADIHHKNHRGQNALMLAARKAPGLILNGKYPTPLNEFSARLIKEGADIGATDMDGNSAIHYAYGNKKILELLIKAGASINQLNKKHQTLLHVPAGVYLSLDYRNKPQYGGIPTPALKWLLKQGVDPNARDADGQTSLHAVSRINSDNPQKAAQILIEGGADLRIVDATGTPLSDFHLREGNLKLAKWITAVMSEQALEQQITKGPDTQAPAKKEPVVEAASAPEPAEKKAAPAKQEKIVAERPPQVSAPSDGAFRRFESTDEKTSKFWSIRVSGTEIEVKYGRTGTDGQSQIKAFDTSEAAQKHAGKLIAEKTGKGYHEIENKSVMNTLKVTKEIETQRQRISEAKAILEPILNDANVRDSTKTRIRFVLDIAQPTYLYSLEETPPNEINRLANMVGGWPYTSQKYPWPMRGECPFPPFLQLNLKDISSLSNTNLGDGLLQIWATHESSLIRVVDHADTQTAPSEEYFDTGILGIGEDDSHFDRIEFDQMPHARRNSTISAGRPKPTAIPYFEAGTKYGLDDEDLCDDYHKLIDRAIKLVKKYFSDYPYSNLFGAQKFRQCGYGFYIDMCVNEGWRPLMCFNSDGCDFEFGYDGQGYLLYRIIDSKTEFFFYWER